MVQADMNLLNEGRLDGRDVQEDVAILGKLAAPTAGQRYDREAQSFRSLGCANDVLRIAACADDKQHASRRTMRFDLAGENIVVIVIVGPGSHDRRVRRKADRVQRAPVLQESPNQFAGDVLRIRGRPAVSADQQGVIFA
jgi:hypothetical protein